MRTDSKTGWIDFPNEADHAEFVYQSENLHLLTDAGAIEIRNIIAQLKLQEFATKILKQPQMDLREFKTSEYAAHRRREGKKQESSR